MRFKIKVTQTRELEGWFEADTLPLAEFEAKRECSVQGEIVGEQLTVLEMEYADPSKVYQG